MRFVIVFIFSLLTLASLSQIGGTSAYQFLNLTNSARVASLGGKNISIDDDDLNMVYHNPSLLNEEMDKNLVTNYIRYLPHTGINYGYAAYAAKFKEIGMLAGGIHYVNYGEFIRTDETGTITGDFRAAEYVLNIMWAYPLDSHFTTGVNVKPVLSSLERYNSTGILLDGGIRYTSSSRLTTVALVVRNAGTQIQPYRKGNYEPMPLDIQLGVSHKFKYAPLRINITAHHLEVLDMTYDNPNDEDSEPDPLTGETSDENKLEVFTDKALRHLIFSLEFMPLENFYIRAGYNYQRRQELKLDTRAYTVGFSWGFGLRISKFHLSYARATYHLAGASNHFSVCTDIGDFYKKAK